MINWVWDEVSVALDRAHADPQYPIVPILAAGAKPEDLPSFLAQYQGVVDVERDGEAFNRLVRSVLRRAPRAAVAPEREPFVGLRAFDSSKTHLFFGRDKETNALVTLVRDNHLVMVTGDSGSGKSSLIKAGLVPAFRGGRFARPASEGPDDSIWQVIETRPGSDPFGRLADDLREAAVAGGVSVDEASRLATMVRGHDPATVRDAVLSALPGDLLSRRHVLLVIDQFEEFRTSPHAAAYVACLLSLADPGDSRVRVVTAMRRDFYYACAGFPALYERLECDGRRARFLLGRMSAEGLEASVVEPLRLAGITDRERRNLAAAVLEDVGDQPGELALLEMALTRTWAKRSEHGGDLLAAYRAIGRVDGALAQAADEVFRGLDADDRRRCEVLFVRLVRPAEAGGATRVIAPLREFDEPTQALARDLAKQESSRLLTLGEATVEISHEQLATQWLQYQRWISNAPGDPASGILRDPRGDDLRLLQGLAEDARRWKAAPDQQKATCLAKGYDLGAYLDLTARRDSWLWGTERDFVAASKAELDREEAAKSRTRRNLQRTTVASVVFMLIAVLVAAFAALQWRAAGTQARRSLARQLAAQAVVSRDREPELALLLAAQGVHVEAAQDTRGALLNVLQRHPFVPPALRAPWSPVQGLSFSTDGASLTASGGAGQSTAWNLATCAILPPSGDREAPRLAATPGGRLTATVRDGKLIVSDGVTGRTHTFPDGPDKVVVGALAPDGATVAAGHADGAILLRDVETERAIGEPLLGHDKPVTALAFSPDGATLASADADGTTLLWPVSLEAWKTRACGMAAWPLTPSEDQLKPGEVYQARYREVTRFLGDAPYEPACGPPHDTPETPATAATEIDSEPAVPNDMGVVAAGWFWMGCNADVDNQCYADEVGHRVYVDAFAIDRTEVTVAQYRECVRKFQECVQAGGKQCPGCTDEGLSEYGLCNWQQADRNNHPINCVDWSQAKAYCEWAGKRLPREAEWEKAARGRDGRKYPWGNDEFSAESKQWANIADEAAKRELGSRIPFYAEDYDDKFATTAPVGSFPNGASPYGAVDMAGNVYEWVWDSTPGGRGVRGGSWSGSPGLARSSSRYWLVPGSRLSRVGFRCAQ